MPKSERLIHALAYAAGALSRSMIADDRRCAAELLDLVPYVRQLTYLEHKHGNPGSVSWGSIDERDAEAILERAEKARDGDG